MNENENSDKFNGKWFLIIKSGLGFMSSLNALSHKRYGGQKIIQFNIKDCNKVHTQMNSYRHHILYRDVLVIHLSHTPTKWNLI
jgi:hypothetical protein